MVEQIKTEEEYRQCLADVDLLMNTVADDGSVERLQYDLLKMRIVEYDLLAEVERLRGILDTIKAMGDVIAGEPVTEDTAKEVGKVRCSPSGRPQDTVKGGE